MNPRSSVLVVPSSPDAHQKQCEKAAREALRDEDVPEPVTIRTHRVAVQGNGWGRYAEILEPADAKAIYRRFHKEPVLVLAFDDVWVRRDPRRDPPVSRSASPLREFVRYKAVFGRVHRERDVAECLIRFDEWFSTPQCDGDDDPRVLPFHSFSTSVRWNALDREEERKRFKGQHGGPGVRTDDNNRLWIKPRPGAMHGWDSEIKVAGRSLSRGFHWDVELARGTSNLFTPNEVWEISAGEYLNVSPESDVRRNRKTGGRQVWPHYRTPKRRSPKGRGGGRK